MYEFIRLHILLQWDNFHMQVTEVTWDANVRRTNTKDTSPKNKNHEQRSEHDNVFYDFNLATLQIFCRDSKKINFFSFDKTES